ncbi:hypothetical protein DEO72_LG2g3538 [Vigna unguiculata]|uniref:Uncharacterized protein n=1 Tax=Vigna unguiculata TaxID=3917 RepID=A0A4D6L419_VIGUN|nr:hypothetical protein DEO72_LG2g3538 [Vigna unguiculata]
MQRNIPPLLPTGVSRICSHQRGDDHRKSEYHTAGNTLRHDSTHPDTYNHGRIQQTLALVVDTSAHPRAMCYKCFNESISLTTRLALNEFQASCYAHHKNGAPPWTPTSRGHGITSRPLKRDPETQYLKPSKHFPYKAKKIISSRTASPSTSLRLKGLAQARRARSGEPPSPRRGLEKASREQRGISLRRARLA